MIHRMIKIFKPVYVLIIIATVYCFTGCAVSNQIQDITMAVTNARIWTGDPAKPWAEAMAIHADTITFVGTTTEVMKMTDKNTQVIDAAGKLVTPGFNDAHLHFIDGGFGLSSVQLRDAKTRQQFTQRIAEFVKTVPAGTWITGGDWDHTHWGGELPIAAWIDSVSPNHPVFVQRLDGHMALANSAAMKLANVSATTKDLSGGTIVRGADGSPAGVFKDNAMGLFSSVISNPSDDLKDRALVAAMEHVAKQGVTSVQSMGSWDDLRIYKRAHQKNALNTRIYAVVPLATWQRLRDTVQKNGTGDKNIRIGGLKGYVDGSLGSHTAAFLKPFTDAPSDSGLLVTPIQTLYNQTSGADKAGLQVMVHAIGDRAIHEQLNIFERVAGENKDRDRRFRIEHAQHIAPADISRFGSLKVIASMEPYHAIDDGRWAEPLIGPERIKTTYAFRNLLDTKAVIAFGSDWFVAPPTPLEGIYAAVTRRTLDDKNPNGWVPEQKITVEEALKAYTSAAAYASFDEKIKGSLQSGKLADFVLLDKDITRIAPETIRDVKVIMTVVGGKVVYQKDK